MNGKKVAMYGCFIFIILGLVVIIHTATAETSIRVWTNFGDGVAYWSQVDYGLWGTDRSMGVIIDGGEEIRCDDGIFMHGGITSPECFEVILRHELDRRGL